MARIRQKNDKILRQVAKEVPMSDIGTSRLEKIIKKMKSALASQADGVAIAAPQVGESIRMFVVSGKVLALLKGEEEKVYPDEVYINPKIVKYSKDKKLMEEGCLSVRFLYGKVRRSNKVNIEAYNERGERVKRGASGLLAQIFQHEYDHLEGILFIDKTKIVEEMSKEVWESHFKKTTDAQ